MLLYFLRFSHTPLSAVTSIFSYICLTPFLLFLHSSAFLISHHISYISYTLSFFLSFYIFCILFAFLYLWSFALLFTFSLWLHGVYGFLCWDRFLPHAFYSPLTLNISCTPFTYLSSFHVAFSFLSLSFFVSFYGVFFFFLVLSLLPTLSYTFWVYNIFLKHVCLCLHSYACNISLLCIAFIKFMGSSSIIFSYAYILYIFISYILFLFLTGLVAFLLHIYILGSLSFSPLHIFLFLFHSLFGFFGSFYTYVWFFILSLSLVHRILIAYACLYSFILMCVLSACAFSPYISPSLMSLSTLSCGILSRIAGMLFLYLSSHFTLSLVLYLIFFIIHGFRFSHHLFLLFSTRHAFGFSSSLSSFSLIYHHVYLVFISLLLCLFLIYLFSFNTAFLYIYKHPLQSS